MQRDKDGHKFYYWIAVPAEGVYEFADGVRNAANLSKGERVFKLLGQRFLGRGKNWEAVAHVGLREETLSELRKRGFVNNYGPL